MSFMVGWVETGSLPNQSYWSLSDKSCNTDFFFTGSSLYMLNYLPGHESLVCLKTKEKTLKITMFKESLQHKIERTQKK